jgi:hypothetical protein
VCASRRLLDQWNKNHNNLDSPTRAVWYKMGKELEGVTVSLDGSSYKWACIAEVKLEVKKVLTSEIETTSPQESCVMCWHATKNSAC